MRMHNVIDHPFNDTNTTNMNIKTLTQCLGMYSVKRPHMNRLH